MCESYSVPAGWILPVYRLGAEFVTDDQTGAGLHAALGIVDQLLLPDIHLGRADVEAWLLFTLETSLSVHRDKGFRIPVER